LAQKKEEGRKAGEKAQEKELIINGCLVAE